MGVGGGEGAGPIAFDDEGDGVAFADGAFGFGDAKGEQLTGFRIADVADAQDFVETDNFTSAVVNNNSRVGRGGLGRDPQMVPKIFRTKV